jgi:hypothetical protein
MVVDIDSPGSSLPSTSLMRHSILGRECPAHVRACRTRGDRLWHGFAPRKSSWLARRCLRQAIITLVLNSGDLGEGEFLGPEFDS